MNKKITKEEELIYRIRQYREEIHVALKDKFFQERDQRHSAGEVFFEGYWVPKDLVPKIRQKLARRGKIVFFETNLLVFVFVFLNIFLWIIFKFFLLPHN
jgi:hypothetical protein